MIRKWKIKVNQKKHKWNYILQINDEVSFPEDISAQLHTFESLRNKKQDKLLAEKLENLKIYEDENWFVINKESWTPMHPGKKNENKLTVSQLIKNYFDTWFSTFTPMFAYRLDRFTTWVVLIGKNYPALKYINSLIRNRKTQKIYLAAVFWDFPEEKEIDFSLKKFYDNKLWVSRVINDDKNGDTARTHATKLETTHLDQIWTVSLLKITISTWRMHQIRAHLSMIWYPILWDLLYLGNQRLNSILTRNHKINNQMLHCYRYLFYDKFKGKKVMFEAMPPESFRKNFNKLNG